jgi:hypothetical protein
MMKPFLLLVLATAQLGYPPASIAAQCARPGVIQLANGYSVANVYAQPSTRSAVLTRLGAGDQICILGTGSHFHRIQVGSLIGYIKRR